MNAPVRKVAIAAMVLFALLILNVNYIQVVRANALRKDEGNTRQLYQEYDRERGSITVAGNPIAASQATDGALKYLRTYPDGPTYAPVTGWYSLVSGTTGLEQVENDVLSGSDPRLTFRRLADLFTGRDPAGGNVELTLDPNVQKTAMDGLLALDGMTGAVVALDPETGAVLGLASAPTFDPNQLSSHEPAKIREYRKSLTNQQLLNHAIDDRYSPGSVFKVVVSAAALSTGDYTAQTAVPAPDLYTPPGTSKGIQNYNGETCNGGGDQPLLEALEMSCNTAFAQLGVTLGEDKVRDMAEAFGIDDEKSEIPLEVNGSTLGDIPDQPALAQSSIGQRDVQLTPLQAAMIAATVANKGTQMKPYLVKSIQAPDLTTIDQTDPEELGNPISEQVAAQLDDMMTAVVTGPRGTGKKAAIPGVKVAGKTGTAQTDPDAKDNSWFVGYADKDGRKIAVAVFIKGGGTGGDKSAPLAKQVMQAYLSGQGD
ncbi:penicillin-binding protein 2 [Modestobacter sp. NPDC049651]|uniref:peptidoglycan D,D-transpeptidase FtsI family protein n=1 Tax=unclassified Modestobacter TaxID=2643866 RepID=UPI0033C174D3